MYIKVNPNDMSDELTDSKLNPSKKTVSICFGCGHQISDQFILRVAPDLEWHAKCLKCAECDRFLDESCTCFVRNGKTYCKLDYIKLFSKKCFKCKESFNKNDFVMRASSNRIYHVDCFRCVMCNKQFSPGDEYALKDDGILCKTDNEIYEKQQLHSIPPPPPTSSSNHIYPSPHQPLTCQNITNLPPNSSLNSPLTIGGKLVKCEDFSSSIGHNDYEDNQNCLSPAFGPPPQHHMSLPLQNAPPPPPPPSQMMSPHLTTLSSPMINPLHHPIQNGGHVNMSSNNSSSGNSSQHHHHSSGHHRMNGGGGSDTTVNTTSGSSSSGGSRSSGHGHGRKDKTTRVRTVLNEKQLHTLRTCYGANPRPDALMKEQLVEMTGLSPRVIRVWFQNKRCKDKKKTILIKQLQEQQKNRQSIGNGIPMIASSPVRNDISNLGPGSQIEMQSTSNAYQASSSSSVQWMNGGGYDPMSSSHHHHHHHHLGGGSSSSQMNYDNALIGYSGSDEEDFDQMSDPNGDDSSDGGDDDDDTRIQQL